MKEITFDEYEAMCERYEEAPFKCENWFPTIDDIKFRIEPEIDKNIDFLVWIVETCTTPRTDEEKEVVKYINDLIKKNVEFVEQHEKTSKSSKKKKIDEKEIDEFEEGCE